MSSPSKPKGRSNISSFLNHFRSCLINIVTLFSPQSGAELNRSLLCHAEYKYIVRGVSYGSFYLWGAKIWEIYFSTYLPSGAARTKVKKPQPFLRKEAEGVLHVHLTPSSQVSTENKKIKTCNELSCKKVTHNYLLKYWWLSHQQQSTAPRQ